jgi:tRNA-specific adenosine deaminase 2
VHNDVVIARGMNATNVTRNGTRHAEFMALSALLSYAPENGPRTTCLRPKQGKATQPDGASDAESTTDSGRPLPNEGNEDGRKGHLYPYGQKLHPDRKVDRAIIQESILYVTVEPCVMCASLLRQLGIKKVYFGAVNDKFGGTGGVFSIHANSLPVSEDGQTASAHPTPKPVQLPDGSGYVLGMSYPPGGGDGGNAEPGYEIEGGWGRDEAVGLLRRFYVQENGRAPIPRKKEGRAARLAALLEQDGNASNASLASQSTRDGDADDMATESLSRKENIDPLERGKDKMKYGDEEDDEEETIML